MERERRRDLSYVTARELMRVRLAPIWRIEYHDPVVPHRRLRREG